MLKSNGRWQQFIRTKEYRQRCDSQVAELIEDFRRRSNRMLIILGIASALLLYRFWPLLKPDFL